MHLTARGFAAGGCICSYILLQYIYMYIYKFYLYIYIDTYIYTYIEHTLVLPRGTSRKQPTCNCNWMCIYI